jgi:short-subunit dehydrogenase
MSAASKPATAAFALVTGASSGIGAIYADRLAKRRRSVARSSARSSRASSASPTAL